MYFIFCQACNCFEYDCHGLEGCIKREDNYQPPRQRYAVRQRQQEEAGIVSDAIITDIAAILTRVQEEEIQWSDLSDKDKNLLNLHFSVLGD